MKYLAFSLFLFIPLYGKAEIKNRVGIFVPQAKLFREVYGNIGPSYEVEASQVLSHYPKLSIASWENFGLTYMVGNSTAEKNQTTIVLANLSGGIKFANQLGRSTTEYLGFGAVASGVWINNQDSSCCTSSKRLVFGGVLKLGITRYITNSWFMDFFMDYTYQPVHFSTNTNLGGARIGLGLGALF